MNFTKNIRTIKKKRWTVEDYIKLYLQSDEYQFSSYEDSVSVIVGAIEKALFQNGIKLPIGVYVQRLRFSFEREFDVNPDTL